MATVARPQQQNVQPDGGVAERRLRPIYEWLDNGNNKKALQEADKVLRKTPTLQAARALRALALLRLGREGEALTVLAALAAERPSDDTTLQAMTISYRESLQLRKVCELYEEAVKAESTSEDLYTHLFMAYVRVGDFKAQQQTAVALYKVAPKNPYYFWAVMSIVLQAKETEDSVKKNVLLSLAQRMVDKFIAENKMEAQQEARLYIMILQLQDKYEDILKFMESPLYHNLVPGVMPAATIPYLRLLARWRQLNTLCKELLWDNLDRWDYYEPYLDSTFHLMQEEDSEETAEKCHEFICQLIENIPSGRMLRGPYLARLELYQRLKDADKEPEVLMGGALDLCVEYLRVFAHKPCCVVDVKPYLRMIQLEERHSRSREFLTCLGMDEHTMPETIEEVQRHVSCLGMWRLCCVRSDAAGYCALASLLRSHYLRALARGLAPSTATEFPAADTYAVLSARQYYCAAMERQSSAPILEALSLLEFVLKNSPSNFHCKLLCLKFYHVLGNGAAADSIYSTLEVKHVQLSSLGWLHAVRLQPAALPSRALQLHSHTRRFHTHNARYSVDHLTYSYKYGTFEKLCELMEFVRRLERCAWCAAADLECALLELLTGAGSTFNQPPAHPPLLSDNRDLTVMTNYDPPHMQHPALQQETFRHELAHLRLRSSVVNAVALSIELASAAAAAAPADKPLDKEALLKELGEWLDKFDVTFSEFRRDYQCLEGADIVSAPFPSRIIALVNSPVPYRELYVTVLGLAGALARGAAQRPAAQAACERAATLLAESRAALSRQLGERNGADHMWTCRESLEDISNYVEFIGIVTFELGVCHELITPHSKRSKKKNAPAQSPADLRTAELLAAANRSALDCIRLVEETLDACAEPAVPQDLAELFTQLTLHQNYEDPVQQKLQAGHAAAMADLRTVLAKKSKFLKSIL